MPRLRRKRVLAAKIETTPGTAISLAAADGVFNVFDPTIKPDIEMDDREGQSAFSRIPATIGPLGGTLTFTTDLIPGSAAHPAWATTFLPACGFVATANVYSPATEAPGTNVKTLSMGLFEDGLFKSIIGAMGNCVFKFDAGHRITMDWTFRGIWVPPTDVAIIAPTYPTLLPLRFVSSALTIGGVTPRVKDLTLDLGNEVILREDSTTSSGYSTALVTGRRVNGTMNPESELVATWDYHGLWIAHTEVALNIGPLVSGGIGFTFGAPKLQFMNSQEGDRNGTQIDDIEFQCNRSAAAGNDELTITVDQTV